MDRGNYVNLGAVLFDSSKAGAPYQWFVSFLTGRAHVSLVDGSTSDFSALQAGVPQGTILSPLLFFVYMDDIPFGDSTNLFADDTSSYVMDHYRQLCVNCCKNGLLVSPLGCPTGCSLFNGPDFAMASLCQSCKTGCNGFPFTKDAALLSP